MRSKGLIVFLRWTALGILLVALLLTVWQLSNYSRMRSSLPGGLVMAGIPVGGLAPEQAADRLVQAYSVPVELHYNDAVIQIKPQVIGFELDLESMLAAADLQRINQPFWSAFWDYLWNNLPVPTAIPLRANISEERLRTYLKDEITPRYDQQPESSVPVAGSTGFTPGKPGTVLDVDRAVLLIEDALRSPGSRVVNLSYSSVKAPRPTLQNLQVLLQQVIQVDGFDGVTELYLQDQQTGQEIHFAYQQGQNLTPDVAFTAASTMKIPIMVSTFRRLPDPMPKNISDLMALMIDRSENDPADSLMQQVLDKITGPLQVTDDMQKLGLNNTFIAGYFAPGSPLLKKVVTPANSRSDVNLLPDVYNQTSPAEMGMLLSDIYQCSASGGGSFAAVFPGELTKNKCLKMIDYLSNNRIGVLIQAGVPEGTRVAHKHGWITEADGYIHTISDAGIIYTPGGNYILTIYMYRKDQLLFDPANKLVAQLSRAVYNYFNPAQ